MHSKIISAVSVISVFISIVVSSNVSLQAQEKNIPFIRIGQVGHDHHLPLFVAADCGADLAAGAGGYWLKKIVDRHIYDLMLGAQQKARVEVIKVGGGSGMPSALSRENIDIGFGGFAPAVFAIDKGAAIKVVAPVNADGDMLVISNKMNINNWREFLILARKSIKPIKIGYKAPKAVAYLIFMAALRHEGIIYGPSEQSASGTQVQVQLINLNKDSNMVPSLQSGVVDGFVMNQPQVALAEFKGVGKVIAQLRDLPPEGEWYSHPCCCVAANSKFITEHKEELEGLLKLFRAAAIKINDKNGFDGVLHSAIRWSGAPHEVEKKSIPSNLFVVEADRSWLAGCKRWYEMMIEMKQFGGSLKGKTPGQIEQIVADYLLAPVADK